MVFNLKQKFKQSGVTLPLEKHAGAVYRLGSRKLQARARSSFFCRLFLWASGPL